MDVLSVEEPGEEFVVSNAASLWAGVRHFRREAGLSQGELAGRTRLGQPDLSRLENGAVSKQMEAWVETLQELGVEIVLRKRQRGG